MDKEKIDCAFADLKNKGMLMEDGAFYDGLSSQTSRSKIFAFFVVLIGLVLGFFFYRLDYDEGLGWVKIMSPILGASFCLLLLHGMWTDSSLLYWYRDRLVCKNVFGYNAKEYMYSDWKRIARCRQYDSKSKCYYTIIQIFSRTPNVEPISIRDDSRTRHFLSSCFPEIFCVDEELETRMRFFAKVLKMNALSGLPSERELQCAVRYFTGLKMYDYLNCDNSYFPDRLLSLMKQYNYDSKEACVEDCQNQGFELMIRDSMTYGNRLELLASLFEYAYVGDGMVDEKELDFLSQIASTFGINSWDFISLKCRFEREKQEEAKRKNSENARQEERYRQVRLHCEQEAYSLLNLSPGATLEDIKSAYRKLVKTCHPDTLPPTASGIELEMSTIRFRMITEAYDFLCAELSAEPVSVAR